MKSFLWKLRSHSPNNEYKMKQTATITTILELQSHFVLFVILLGIFLRIERKIKSSRSRDEQTF